MCFGGQKQQPYPPTPPSPEQVAYDKLQRDKEIRRASYLANGLPDPGGGTVVVNSDNSRKDVVLGQSQAENAISTSVR